MSNKLNNNDTFIDLFAGVGGFHMALSNLGMKAVFASEIDKHARETYLKNHKIDEEIFNDDIRAISPSRYIWDGIFGTSINF